MVFNSLTFILFFIIVLILHNLPFPWRVKKFNLLIASYIFYAAWSPPFVFLLWVATVIDWFVAQWMAKTEDNKKRKRILLISLVANLGMLGYFKYGNFLLANFVSLMKFLRINYQPAEFNIILPIGISFYTFVTLSYTIDVYRRKIKPANSFLDYALLITFFPHLVAGPILRAAQFLPQCLTPKKANAQQLGWGLSLIVFGLFDKVVLADGIVAPVADVVFAMKGNVGWDQAFLAMLAFTPQVFLDFNGYSLCAIGSAMCLGFVFPDNFRFPFAAIGFTDLWRRWHISLSSWLRDYLYVPLSFWLRDRVFIPLGGKKKSYLQTSLVLFFVMSIAGLWHGAAWHFIVWGGLQGICMGFELVLKRFFGSVKIFNTKLVQICLMLFTFLMFNFIGVLFRSFGLENALKMYKVMFTGATSVEMLYSQAQMVCVILVILWLLITHWLLRDSSIEAVVSKLPTWMVSLLIFIMLLSILLISGESDVFIYFQF